MIISYLENLVYLYIFLYFNNLIFIIFKSIIKMLNNETNWKKNLKNFLSFDIFALKY